MRKILGALVAAMTLLNAGSALAVEPEFDILCIRNFGGNSSGEERHRIYKVGDEYEDKIDLITSKKSTMYGKNLNKIEIKVDEYYIYIGNTVIISRQTGDYLIINASVDRKDLVTASSYGKCSHYKKLF